MRPALGERKLASIRPIELDELYAALYATGLSARTVRICHTVVRQALEQARKWGLIARSPAVDATPPGQPRREVMPPTVEQVRTLIEHARAEDPDLGTYLWLLAVTGCRRGEACALRWSDVDLERGDVTIRRAMAMAGSTPYEKGTKTHQARRVALDAATVGLLREHRQRMRERALRLGVGLADDAYLFADIEGRRSTTQSGRSAVGASQSDEPDGGPLATRPRPGFSTEAVQAPARVKVTCVTPQGEEVASTS